VNWTELIAQLQARGHRRELEEIAASIRKEMSGLRGSRASVAEAHAQMQLSQLVTQYMDGTTHTDIGTTEQRELAKHIAEALLNDVKKDTNKRLMAVVAPSPDRLVDRPERGSGRFDVGSALAKLEVFLKREGGLVRLVGDREAFTAVYREIGATSDTLSGALADLAGKLERSKKT